MSYIVSPQSRSVCRLIWSSNEFGLGLVGMPPVTATPTVPAPSRPKTADARNRLAGWLSTLIQCVLFSSTSIYIHMCIYIYIYYMYV